MSTHTPGPWRIQRTESRPEELYSVVQENNPHAKVVLLVYLPATKANASLIAAAPELLEACKKAIGYADESGTLYGILQAAIAKVKAV
jgi:hypothetical protein